jgi:hypothetical protein
MALRKSGRRLALMMALFGWTVLAVLWGQQGPRSAATAAPPQAPAAASSGTSSGDYAHQTVAYIYDTIPVTRQELGEYLIARMGADRLPNLVNKRVIEHECQKLGIEVTAAEVEAGLEEDLKGLSVNRKDFVEKVLKHYKKTLYEWKEDVIKPRLLMTRLCKDRVKVTEDDIKMAFDAYYGEKIDCRIILWPKSDGERVAMSAYAKVRESEEEFDRAARNQASAQLAAKGGRVTPIGHNTTGNEALEKAAFSLQPGELSQLLQTNEGFVVLKCDKRIPADATKKLADERARLEKECYDKKVQLEIPKIFKEMQDRANVKLILREQTNDEELLRDIRRELGPDAGKAATPPKGN